MIDRNPEIRKKVRVSCEFYVNRKIFNNRQKENKDMQNITQIYFNLLKHWNHRKNVRTYLLIQEQEMSGKKLGTIKLEHGKYKKPKISNKQRYTYWKDWLE